MEFKVVLIGNAGVGKTTWLDFLGTAQVDAKYVATLGVNPIKKLDFDTSHGIVSFNCWDTAGNPMFGGKRVGYLSGADAAIVVYDSESVESVQEWVDLANNAGVKSIVLVRSKCEQEGDISHLSMEYPHVEISIVSNLCTREPYLKLARILLGDE